MFRKKRKAMESFIGLKEKCTRGSGKTENKMEKVLCFTRMGDRNFATMTTVPGLMRILKAAEWTLKPMKLTKK